MKIEVSNGEILDKYSILEIKLQKITEESKRENIIKEYTELTPNITDIFASADNSGNLTNVVELYEDV